MTSENPLRGLLERWLPEHAEFFKTEYLPPVGGLDVFEIESINGKIVLRGSTGVAQASALNWYLKYVCNCHISWDSVQLDLPNPPPTTSKIRKETPYQYRYYFNYCTFSYSTPFWDWERWQREIDWMALNGINAPLSVTGQEAIWEAVYRKLGLTDEQIDEFLVGAAYLPFGWMGCIDRWGGPLPESWNREHAELQKQIAARQQAFGMKPILQGFTGHVPPALSKVYPDCQVHQLSSWAQFPPTYFLDPADPMFERIGSAFIEEQTRQFGTSHLYAADTFIEMVPASNDPEFLKALAQSIYRAMASADPEAVWVLQGWPFLFHKNFWQPEQIRGLFEGVADENILLLDLYADQIPMWQETKAFYGKPWVWCMLHSFGGRPGLFGNFQAVAHELPAALQHPDRGQLVGIGISAEAIETNPALYDLLCEMTWHQQALDLSTWTRNYATRRYGKQLDATAQAWRLLQETVYDTNRQILTHHGSPQALICQRPPLNETAGWRLKRDGQFPQVVEAWSLLLSCADQLHAASGFQRDIVDLGLQTLTHLSEATHSRMVNAYQEQDTAAFRQHADLFLQIISDMDRLAGTRKEHLLGSWIASARNHGHTADEQTHLEWNARNLVTLWGPPESSLHDYSCRFWSGLLAGFYRPRWELFIQHLEAALTSGTPFDQNAFEREVIALEAAWTRDTTPQATQPDGDSAKEAHQLFTRYQPFIAAMEVR